MVKRLSEAVNGAYLLKLDIKISPYFSSPPSASNTKYVKYALKKKSRKSANCI
jgi:hypothetical protein